MNHHPFAIGTSFKHDHLAAIVEQRPQQMFFEVHAENYMGAGGPAHRALAAIRRDHPLSVHGVCMSIGGPGPLDARHLSRLREVVARYEPALVSEHLAWSSHEGAFYNDLLPLPYTSETLATVCAHIGQVQDTLQRSILLENPSTYVAFEDSTFSEADFLRAIAQRTGCGLLLDINNVFVSATNQQYPADRYLAEFPLECVGEIHLAGHSEQRDDEDALLLIDSHDRAIANPVWALYADVIARTGAVPTLIEWDSQLPAWPVLLAEALHAQRILLTHRTRFPVTSPLMPHDTDIAAATTRAFAAGLLDPTLATPHGVVAPRSKGVVKRYNVYRNNVTVSLIDALAAVYPAVQHITGVEFFRAMARFHVRATPPVSPLLFEYGYDFPAFIEAYEYARELPWLADVARIERAWLDAYHAEDQPSLAADTLAQIDAGTLMTLRFVAHPSARIVRSRFSAVSIFAMHRNEGPITPVEPRDPGEPEDALVTRIDQDVTVSRLPPGGAVFLHALFDGEGFAEAVAAALEAEPAFDLSANLTGMISAGAFTTIRTGTGA